MRVPGKPISLWSAAFMGIGAMVGAGIFALLGQAGAIASSSVYISFILSGIIALLSGYSIAKLGVRFPSAGGLVEYIVQGYGNNYFSGAACILLYISFLIGLALIAKTFGAYAFNFLPAQSSPHWVTLFAIFILFFLGAVNYRGAKDTAKLETILVVVKLGVLVIFGVMGLIVIKPELLAVDTYPSADYILFSVSITFFAYTGFSVITNTVEDIPDPSKTLPKALFLSISVVMFLYVIVAIAVFGNMHPEAVIAAKDYALAEAAKPIFGKTGFIIVSVVALISTASSINASLYAVTNATYQLAKEGELPSAFGKPFGHSREGLVISLIIIGLLTAFFNLTQIATVGSISILIIYVIIHLGHLKIIRKTKASPFLVFLALVSSLSAMILAFIYCYESNHEIIYLVIGFIIVAFCLEYVLRNIKGREIIKRI